MIHLTKADLDEMPRLRRINIINSITGIKPANLIGTLSSKGQSNLAVFSSVVHLGSNPPIIGMVSRPSDEVPRHTFQNIKDVGYYTINHIHESIIQKAHYTSAKFEEGVSEFEQCELTEEYIQDFKIPFVKESQIKLGMRFLQIIPIEINGTILIIGEIEQLIFPKSIMNEEGQLNLAQAKGTGISGLNTYYKLEKLAEFPYARPQELPDFES